MVHSLFPFIGPGHPFFAQVEDFRRRIAAHPRASAWAEEHAGQPTTIHAEVKALPAPGGDWQFDRFYWSLQSWDAAAAQPFDAITLSYAAKTGQTEWYDFPRDSYLTTMADFFRGEAAPVEVLRYVPLRRLTFRARAGQGEPVIGKFKRRSRFREAYGLLGVVAAAIEDAVPGFAVSRPLAIDEARCLYYQSALAGSNLADAVDRDNCDDLLAAVGALHSSLHEVPVAALPVAEPAALLHRVRRDMSWISFFEPQHAPLFENVLTLLQRHAGAVVGGPAVFCHGDFVCSQILMAEEGWSVTDFDLCHRGDPCRDMAILLASLPYDLPLFQAGAAGEGPADRSLLERAAGAYLRGYAGQAGAQVDPLRLAWHRIGAEIYYLALMLKKDRFARPLADHRLDLVRALARRLEDSDTPTGADRVRVG